MTRIIWAVSYTHLDVYKRQALMRYYARRGVVLAENEIFVGDGAKSDIGNILDLFDVDTVSYTHLDVYKRQV